MGVQVISWRCTTKLAQLLNTRGYLVYRDDYGENYIGGYYVLVPQQEAAKL